MPVISSFFGIAIRIYSRDHPPPHLHAEHQGVEATFSIPTGEPLQGRLGRRAERLVKSWISRHQVELIQNWNLAYNQEPTFRIPGPDADV